MSKLSWRILNQKDRRYAQGYIRNADGKKSTISLHRFLMKPEKGITVDHINGDGLDNRRSNLWICTHSENMMNQRAGTEGRSHYKGVAREGKSWRAKIEHMGKQMHIGTFGTEEEAATAYNEKAKELFGEFAKLNVVIRVRKTPDRTD